jgi:hypothetical protein
MCHGFQCAQDLPYQKLKGYTVYFFDRLVDRLVDVGLTINLL